MGEPIYDNTINDKRYAAWLDQDLPTEFGRILFSLDFHTYGSEAMAEDAKLPGQLQSNDDLCYLWLCELDDFGNPMNFVSFINVANHMHVIHVCHSMVKRNMELRELNSNMATANPYVKPDEITEDQTKSLRRQRFIERRNEELNEPYERWLSLRDLIMASMEMAEGQFFSLNVGETDISLRMTMEDLKVPELSFVDPKWSIRIDESFKTFARPSINSTGFGFMFGDYIGR